MQDVLDGLRRRAAVPVDVEIDPALYRPHDAPVVIGDHQRLTRDTGWHPIIPLERTLDDLLAFWREMQPETGRLKRTPRAQLCLHLRLHRVELWSPSCPPA